MVQHFLMASAACMLTALLDGTLVSLATLVALLLLLLLRTFLRNVLQDLQRLEQADRGHVGSVAARLGQQVVVDLDLFPVVGEAGLAEEPWVVGRLDVGDLLVLQAGAAGRLGQLREVALLPAEGRPPVARLGLQGTNVKF